MKQKTKQLSVLLAFSLILGSIPGTNASAAKKVSITKKVNVTAGKTTKIKLKNNKKKVSWKVTKGKNVVKITKKNKSYATIKGVKKGSAEVQAKIGKKKYTCKVTVKAKATAKATQKPTDKITPTPTDKPTGTSTPSENPTATATTEPTGTPTAATTTEPTGTPGQDEVLTLYYNDENAEEVREQILDSEIPVHVIVEDSVTSLRMSAFAGCSRLTSIVIGNGVTAIDAGVFWGCSGLTSITIPDSVTSIEYDFDQELGDYTLFYGCSSLTSITWKGNTYVNVREFLTAFKNR